MDSEVIKLFNGFAVKSDTVFTVITTLSVFLSGIIVTAMIKEYTNHSKRRINRILVEQNLTSVIEGLRLQIAGFNQFASSLDIDSNSPFIISHKTITQIDSINSIGHKELYQSYFSGTRNWLYGEDDIRIKCVSDLWSIIHHLNIYNEQNKKDALDIVVKLEEFTDLRNFSFQKVLRQLEQFLLQNSGTTMESDFKVFFIKINDFLTTFKQSEDVGLPSSIIKFLETVSSYMRSETQLCIKYKDKIDIIEISESMNIALHRYNNHFNFLQSSATNFKNKVSTYQRYIEDLMYCNKHLCGVK